MNSEQLKFGDIDLGQLIDHKKSYEDTFVMAIGMSPGYEFISRRIRVRVEIKQQTFFQLQRVTMEDGAILEEITNIGFGVMDANHNAINGAVVYAIGCHSKNMHHRRIAFAFASGESKLNTATIEAGLNQACQKLFPDEDATCEHWVTDDALAAHPLEEVADEEVVRFT